MIQEKNWRNNNILKPFNQYLQRNIEKTFAAVCSTDNGNELPRLYVCAVHFVPLEHEIFQPQEKVKSVPIDLKDSRGKPISPFSAVKYRAYPPPPSLAKNPGSPLPRNISRMQSDVLALAFPRGCLLPLPGTICEEASYYYAERAVCRRQNELMEDKCLTLSERDYCLVEPVPECYRVA